MSVKGAWLNLESLLASKTMSQTYANGSAMIVRLAPYDYHRFHFPVNGEANDARTIKGEYHSVHPIALGKVPDVFCRNKRNVTELFSDNFGRIAYIEVGAITVGSIVQTYIPGMVTKGQEKGYFQYGGSTIILLFEPNAIAFDEDLIRDSEQNIEVSVLAGSQIGMKNLEFKIIKILWRYRIFLIKPLPTIYYVSIYSQQNCKESHQITYR